MDKRNAILDASFWINAHHGGLVGYLSDYFDLFVPMAVIYVDGLLSYDDAEAILVRSEIAKHLKRAAMTALAFLARQRSDHDDDCTS